MRFETLFHLQIALGLVTGFFILACITSIATKKYVRPVLCALLAVSAVVGVGSANDYAGVSHAKTKFNDGIYGLANAEHMQAALCALDDVKWAKTYRNGATSRIEDTYTYFQFRRSYCSQIVAGGGPDDPSFDQRGVMRKVGFHHALFDTLIKFRVDMFSPAAPTADGMERRARGILDQKIAVSAPTKANRRTRGTRAVERSWRPTSGSDRRGGWATSAEGIRLQPFVTGGKALYDFKKAVDTGAPGTIIDSAQRNEQAIMALGAESEKVANRVQSRVDEAERHVRKSERRRG